MIGFVGKRLLERCAGAKAVAEQGEVARAAAPGDEAAERAGDIGQRAQGFADAIAAQRVFVKPLDKGEPGFDRAALGEGRRQVIAEQAPARRRDAAVDRGEQAAGGAAALHAADFEAVAGGGVDRHQRVARDPARRGEESGGVLLGGVEVSEQAARRGEFGAAWAAEAVERGDPETRLQGGFAGEAVEPALARGGGDPRYLVEGDGLGRCDPGQFGPKLARAARDQFEAAGRNVGGGNRIIVARAAHRCKPVGRAGFEQDVLGQRARRHQPNDRPLDQRLGAAGFSRFGGAFDLLGDGDTVTGTDQPREIALRGVDRDAAHRHRIAAIGTALGQRNVERRRRSAGVVEEEFEEVAHAVE